MESNNLHNSPDFKVKNVIYTFLPLLFAVLIQYLVTICDVAIIFFSNVASNERTVSSRTIETIMAQDYNQPMNKAFMSAAQFLLYGLIFGIWYYRTFCRKSIAENASLMSHMKSTFKKHFISLTAIFMLIAGFAGQLMVDSVLTLARPLFSSAFEAYDKLVSNVTGVSSSPVMLIAVIVLAPIAEEILFRGLVMKYSRTFMNVPTAVLFQGLLFGLYHGNIIQGIYAFILGSILGLIAYKLDSILPAIILHTALNASLLFVPEFLFTTTARCIITGIISLGIFTAMLILSLKSKKEIPSS